MFFDGSRYLRVKDYTVAGPDGRPVTVKRTRVSPPTEGTFIYEVKQGDRLDLLAYRFYRSARKWWLICDANPRFMHPQQLLTPGELLIIPPDRVG